jgi:hypothetical protein
MSDDTAILRLNDENADLCPWCSKLLDATSGSSSKLTTYLQWKHGRTGSCESELQNLSTAWSYDGAGTRSVQTSYIYPATGKTLSISSPIQLGDSVHSDYLRAASVPWFWNDYNRFEIGYVGVANWEH